MYTKRESNFLLLLRSPFLWPKSVLPFSSTSTFQKRGAMTKNEIKVCRSFYSLTPVTILFMSLRKLGFFLFNPSCQSPLPNDLQVLICSLKLQTKKQDPYIKAKGLVFLFSRKGSLQEQLQMSFVLTQTRANNFEIQRKERRSSTIST